MSEKSLIRDVSDTSLWVAIYRADESDRPDALFNDPFARKLAGEYGARVAHGISHGQYTAWQVVIRTCVIDAMIAELIQEGVDLVLNLGAGLDTRPYRLELPARLRWVEVDFPNIIQHKAERLAGAEPRCMLERVSLDLSDRGARKRFFDETARSSKKALILTEGVIPYLSNGQVAELARDLHAVEPFQFWIAEYLSSHVIRFLHSGRSRRQMGGAPFLFRPDHWLGFFKDGGWSPRSVRYLGEESRKLGRPVPMPLWVRLARRLVPGKVNRELGRFAGYMMLAKERTSSTS